MTLPYARLAEDGDAKQIEALRHDALAEIGPARGGQLYPVRPLPSPSDPDRPLWVGVLADTIVGYLAASTKGTVGSIDAVYVDRECRGVGVGGSMMNVALAWFEGRGCTGVDALALPGARNTKNFFEESGFTARLLIVHRRLP